MTKMKRNYTANIIMNISGKVCQLFHYFASKQGLAFNLSCPALKSKQRTYIEHFDNIISRSVWVLILLAFGAKYTKN